MNKIVTGLVLLFVTSAVFAQESPPLVLQDGTPVQLRLSRTVSSADAQLGDTIDFEVLEEVAIGNTVVIPKGGIAWATVTAAQPKRRMGRGGKLDMVLDSVRLYNGQKTALSAVKNANGGGHTGAMTGAIVATAIVLWPAAPLFLLMHGKDITIPKGTKITAYISGDFKLKPEVAPTSVPLVKPASVPPTAIASAPVAEPATPVANSMLAEKDQQPQPTYRTSGEVKSLGPTSNEKPASLDRARLMIAEPSARAAATSSSSDLPTPQSTSEGSIGAWSDEKPRVRHDGIKISIVAPGGPADQAGLEVGDYIVAFDGHYFFTVADLNAEISNHAPGSKVSLRYRRHTTIYDTYVVLGTTAH